MARLCMLGSQVENFVRSPDGKYNLRGINTETEKTFIHDEVANSSQFIIRTSMSDCIESLSNNESDIIASTGPIDDGVVYDSHVVSKVSSFSFLAGLSEANYTDAHERPNFQKYGLMSNIYNFTADTWSVIIIFAAIFVCLTLLKSYTMKIRLYMIGRRRRRMLRAVFALNIRRLLDPRRTELKFVCLLILTMYFLLATPFLLMFKTNQIVMKTLYILDSYERAIESNANVLTSAGSNYTRALLPNELDVEKNNVVNRFWHHFSIHQRKFPIKSMVTGNIDSYVNQLIKGKSILISVAVPLLTSFLCAHSVNHGMNVRLLEYRDPNQRQELEGVPFRKGYINRPVVKIYRRLSEMKPFEKVAALRLANTGLEFLAEKDFDTVLKYTKCSKPDQVDSQAAKAISPGRLHLFASLFMFITLSQIIGALVFLFEKCMASSRRPLRPKRNEILHFRRCRVQPALATCHYQHGKFK